MIYGSSIRFRPSSSFEVRRKPSSDRHFEFNLQPSKRPPSTMDFPATACVAGNCLDLGLDSWGQGSTTSVRVSAANQIGMFKMLSPTLPPIQWFAFCTDWSPMLHQPANVKSNPMAVTASDLHAHEELGVS
ncbi:hypothetical protein EJB05_32880, partial [Eragrostis curvula]